MIMKIFVTRINIPSKPNNCSAPKIGRRIKKIGNKDFLKRHTDKQQQKKCNEIMNK